MIVSVSELKSPVRGWNQSVRVELSVYWSAVRSGEAEKSSEGGRGNPLTREIRWVVAPRRLPGGPPMEKLSRRYQDQVRPRPYF